MNELRNEEKFLTFMNNNGPKAKKSKNNYISWLRFISTKYNIVDDQITQEKIDRVSVNIQNTSDDRSIYNTQKDVSNIKSAMNKYLKFVIATKK
ncbi:hypothetical protein GCM10023314_28260 [Algibacter agarivorans]|uniref:Core-binding (CB) domain-containing protein n=1 Tax=Algibacter agarivorans TaxID=1109741 RepID=A0ABP9GUB5_9FLAO